jgi:hypothetical protein
LLQKAAAVRREKLLAGGGGRVGSGSTSVHNARIDTVAFADAVFFSEKTCTNYACVAPVVFSILE